MRRTVLIPSAGTGSRLGSFTANVNKGQMTVGSKPVISYVIEKFRPTDRIIICVGYKGDILKQVIEECYPDWDITFVEVDKWEGEGSGPGYSIIKARELIKEPFYFFCNDGIITPSIDDIPTTTNTILGFPCDRVDNPEAYRNLKVLDGKVLEVLPKGDPTPHTYPYIGVAYVKDWKSFFEAYDANPEAFIRSGEAAGLLNLKDADFFLCEGWYDTGNLKDLERAKELFPSKHNVLEKPDEAIWFFDDKVVKFHIDPKFISDRLARSERILSQRKGDFFTIPKIISHHENVYSYKYVEGTVASETKSVSEFKRLLDAYFDSLVLKKVSNEQSAKGYDDFYKSKTLKRVNDYLVKFEDVDEKCVINGLPCEKVSVILNEKINWEALSKEAIWTEGFHGDFQMENIIKTGEKYAFIDYRQNFGKVMGSIGDVYYDIGKIWHSFYINDHLVSDNLFSVETIEKNKYEVDIHRTFLYTEYEEVLVKCLKEHNVNIRLAKLIMCIVILSFAALHTYPYAKFAFYFGKYLLNKWLLED